MSFMNISGTTVGGLFKEEDNIKMWVVDKLPPNVSPERDLLVALAEESDRNIEIVAKWLEEAGIVPHREHNKRDKQFAEMMQCNEVILVVCDAEKLKKFDYGFFHRVSESFNTKVVVQGQILSMGTEIINSKDFIQRALIGVHAQAFE